MLFSLMFVASIYIVILVGLIDESNGSFVVITELENLMALLESLTHGAILAIAYLTPVKDKFK